MTPAEVNAEIARMSQEVERQQMLDAEVARARGWQLVPHGSDELREWEAPKSADEWEAIYGFNYQDYGGWSLAQTEIPPPFSSEWALAGPLLEEMGNARTEDNEFNTPGIVRDSEMWIASENIDGCGEFGHGGTTESAPTPTEAIARAWLAWKRAAT